MRQQADSSCVYRSYIVPAPFVTVGGGRGRLARENNKSLKQNQAMLCQRSGLYSVSGAVRTLYSAK